MNLITLSDPKERPYGFMESYWLSEKETIEDCIKSYQRKFGVDPKVGYVWRNQVWFEMPEEAK
jgi:hypothetical protein